MRFDNRTSSMARRSAQVIYFTRLAAEELCIVPVYPKAEKDNIPGHILKQVRKEIEDGDP